MKESYRELIKVLGDSRVRRNELMGKYSSFKIGGLSDLFFRAYTSDDLIKAVKEANRFNIPYVVVGGCTNLLISDKGFRGLVIKNDTSRIHFVGMRGMKKVHTVYVEVESGVSVNRVVRFCLDQGFSGLEAFMGQPGTVGGAVWINAHNTKKGKFLGDRIVSSKLLDENNKIKNVPGKYFHFGYDSSVIQKTREIVISVVLSFEVRDKNKLWQEASQVLKYRQETQPQGLFSSGCTFRNISPSDALRIATPNLTCSVGYLLENVGLKGYKIGSVQFSSDHTNFIINRGEGKASDVLELISLAKNRVKKKYGIDLKEEVVLIGDF